MLKNVIMTVVTLHQVVSSGGSVQVECRVSLGPLEDRSVKTLRFRKRKVIFAKPIVEG